MTVPSRRDRCMTLILVLNPTRWAYTL
uniref:Uncharacterized protein n=1 Tax=Arundo donax TaxID=35708 RepID=A0A0A9FG04_ARUDO